MKRARSSQTDGHDMQSFLLYDAASYLRERVVLPNMSLEFQNTHPPGFAGGETRMTEQIDGTKRFSNLLTQRRKHG